MYVIEPFILTVTKAAAASTNEYKSRTKNRCIGYLLCWFNVCPFPCFYFPLLTNRIEPPRRQV